LLSSKLFSYGFESATWNFFEAAHGKGAADGVGAVIKRTADRLVNQGTDLPTPLEMYNHLSNATSTHLFYVTEQAVKEAHEVFSATAPATLPPLPGTMTVHQLYVCKSKPGFLMHRDISCFCSLANGLCKCFEAKTFAFPPPLSANDSLPTSGETLADTVDVNSPVEGSPNVASCGSVAGESQMQPSVSEIANVGVLTPLESSNAAELIGKFCVVRYDKKLYPGRILEIKESDVTVECTT